MKKIFFTILLTSFFACNINAQVKVKNFSLKNIDNTMYSLDSFKNQKGVILIFVTNTCPVAEMYQKRIDALNKKYAALGYPVVAIDPSDSFEAMKDTALARKYSYYFLQDKTQNIARAYRIFANTHTYILQNTAAGYKIVYDGAIDDDYSGEAISKKYVENALNAVLKNKPVTVKKTKVFACPIKYN
jgi:peroxiredoxin